jgi:phosphate transport system substrate-binding protein
MTRTAAVGRLVVVVLVAAACTGLAGPSAFAQSTALSGGGSSFAGIEMNQWTDDVGGLTPPIEISYVPSSSGQGRTDFRTQVYPYAVSDIPYQGEAAGNDVPPTFSFDYIPIVAGGLGFMYNLPGNPTVKLTAATACGIFTGEITNWDDPALAPLNPGLPNLQITPVLRGDNAGTSWVLSDWCINEAPTVWDSFVTYVNTHNENTGTPPITDTMASSIFPPVGVDQTAQGDSGTAAVVENGSGYITYVEPEYAVEYGNKPVAYVENSSNDFVLPTPENVAGALSYAQAQSNGIQELNFGGAGCNVYNPSTYSYLLARTDGAYGTSYGQTIGGFLNYVLTIGEKEAPSINYASIGLSLEQYGIQAAANIQGYPALSSNENANFAAGDVTPQIAASTPCGQPFQLAAVASTTSTSAAPTTTTTTIAPTTTTTTTPSTTVQTTTTTASQTTAAPTTTPGTTAASTSATAAAGTQGATSAATAPAATAAGSSGTTAATAGRAAGSTAPAATAAGSTGPTPALQSSATTAPSGATAGSGASATTVPGSTAAGSGGATTGAPGSAGPTVTSAPGAPSSSSGTGGTTSAGSPSTSAVVSTTGAAGSSPTLVASNGTTPTSAGSTAATVAAGSSATTVPVAGATVTAATVVGASTAGAGTASATTTVPGSSGSSVAAGVTLSNNTPGEAQTGGEQVALVVVGLALAGTSELARRRWRKAR